ncbi:MAG TPA: tRNA uridine-5-carboxymethylaminomethyl(34) synthesis GTPase MnmE [Kofleriaceae bacterium]|nr:tRNA uridine-5-carboxymethylaminomethyl(34) synthesis GTPase MnmE [Kofleriaceae bacterium]
MILLGDTIAAIATGASPGGVGVIRVSGPRAVEIAAGVIGVEPASLGREVRYAIARDAAGQRLDEVLAFAMRAPRSFTGEDVAEIHAHGGGANLAQLLAAVLAAGARAAEPGEFTRRAFGNGKLDLTRAEALLAVIESGSARAVRVNQELLSGSLAKALDQMEQRATEVMAEIEGSIDFPEDDLTLAPAGWAFQELSALRDQCARWVASFSVGKALRQGITVALVGSVNVGKSSLLNALAGQHRALVSSQPGTTRDYVEIRVEWNGVAVTLIDTAGLRSSNDEIESAGIELGRARAAQAEVVLQVSDQDFAADSAVDSRTILVRSKADLGGGVSSTGVLHTSATTGQGLDELRTRILQIATAGAVDGDDGVMLITERQRSRAQDAALRFGDAAQGLADGRPLEMLALDVRQAVHALAEMRGREVTERVLDEVFARFCIGK